MGIYIKGMDMPDDCKTCELCQYDDGLWGFWFANDEKIADKGRREDCPLTEVPTPHGRLIDADAFYELLDGGYDLDFDEALETKRELLRMITDAPTVIEAEGE